MISRIMMAGMSSGCGKTTVVCAILQALVNRGKNVISFKCGPDYIDPMFHSKIIGTASRNLDGYFMNEETLQYLLYKNAAGYDLSVIEGVMGYYDGLGMEDTASSYALAKDTKTPVVLIVNCKGMSRSVMALVEGYLNFKSPSMIQGVIFNQLAPSLYPAMKEFCEQKNIKALGYLPTIKEVSLKSRHLGLVTADEVENLKEKLQLLAEYAEQYLDIDTMITIASTAEERSVSNPFSSVDVIHSAKKGNVRIGIAKDSAFCFYYEDNLTLLKELGAKLVEFSPLYDSSLPNELDGLYLGGGYPELYAEQLQQNESLRHEIAKVAKEGLPIYAECGGFMYLHQTIRTPEEKEYSMCGVVEGMCYFTKQLQHFGYTELTAQKDTILCNKGEKIRAHEFHRCVSTALVDTFHSTKKEKEWMSCVSTSNVLAGFPHLHFYANPSFAFHFINSCRNEGKR